MFRLLLFNFVADDILQSLQFLLDVVQLLLGDLGLAALLLGGLVMEDLVVELVVYLLFEALLLDFVHEHVVFVLLTLQLGLELL